MDFFNLMVFGRLFGSADDPFTVLWVSMVVGGAIFVVFYVMQAIALWTISGREGYKHRWMSFVPFFNTYYIGVVSGKNKFAGVPAKTLSLALAVIEFLLVAGYAFYYIVAGIIFAGNMYEVVYQNNPLTGQVMVAGYETSSRIAGTWLAWVFNYLDIYVLDWVNLVYVLVHALTVITFFQTYACRRYVIFSFGAVLFPITGVLMFAVRNNAGMNYRDYIMREQRRRYEMYQQYYNGQGGNPYGGYNPYGGSTPPSPGDPYGSNSSRPSAPSDPFDGLGSSSSSDSGRQPGEGSPAGGADKPPEDPFDEFKN